MNIVLLGAPGAGKGTQAFKITEKYGLPQISTGDIFRANIKGGTELGVLAKSYIDKGQLVPDEVVIAIVKDRIGQEDCKNGYMLDGFPRTVGQAESLDKISTIDKVVNVDVDLDSLMARLTGRRVCKECGKSFHISTFSGTVCDDCKGEVYQRADDNEETVGSRLNVYVSQTAPLIEYYSKQGKLATVNGNQAIDDVFADITKVLG